MYIMNIYLTTFICILIAYFIFLFLKYYMYVYNKTHHQVAESKHHNTDHLSILLCTVFLLLLGLKSLQLKCLIRDTCEQSHFHYYYILRVHTCKLLQYFCKYAHECQYNEK